MPSSADTRPWLYSSAGGWTEGETTPRGLLVQKAESQGMTRILEFSADSRLGRQISGQPLHAPPCGLFFLFSPPPTPFRPVLPQPRPEPALPAPRGHTRGQRQGVALAPCAACMAGRQQSQAWPCSWATELQATAPLCPSFGHFPRPCRSGSLSPGQWLNVSVTA